MQSVSYVCLYKTQEKDMFLGSKTGNKGLGKEDLFMNFQ